jgi:hypothetical protein
MRDDQQVPLKTQWSLALSQFCFFLFFDLTRIDLSHADTNQRVTTDHVTHH